MSVRVPPDPDVRAPRRRSRPPHAGVDRAGRARHQAHARDPRRRTADRGAGRARSTARCIRLARPRRAVVAHGPARRPRVRDRGRGAAQPHRRGGRAARPVRRAARRGRSTRRAKGCSRASAPRSSSDRRRPRRRRVRWCAAEDAAAHVFVDDLDDDVTIDGADGHHLQRVRRLRAGEARHRGRRHRRVAALRGDAASAPAALDARRRAAPVRAEPELVPAVGARGRARRRAASTTSWPAAPSSASRASSRCATRRSVVRWDDGAGRGRGGPAADDRPRGRGPEPPGPRPRDRAGRRRSPALAGRPGLVIADRAGVRPAAAARRPGPERLDRRRRARRRLRPGRARAASRTRCRGSRSARTCCGPRPRRSPRLRRCVVATRWPMCVTRGTRHALCSS